MAFVRLMSSEGKGKERKSILTGALWTGMPEL
jgi:hypothetical protein